MTLIGNTQASALKSVSKTIKQNVFWFWFYWEHLVLLLRSKSSPLAYVYKWLVTISNIYLGIQIDGWKSISMEYMNNEDWFHMFTYVCCVLTCVSQIDVNAIPSTEWYSSQQCVGNCLMPDTLLWTDSMFHMENDLWWQCFQFQCMSLLSITRKTKSQKISSIRQIARHHQVRHFQHLAELWSPAEINFLEFPTD